MFIQKNNIFIFRVLALSLLRRRGQFLAALVGIAIGATVLLSMVSLAYDIPRQMSREFRAYGANMIFIPTGGEARLRLEDLHLAAALLPRDRLVGLTPHRYETVRSNMLPYTAAGLALDEVQKTSPYWRVEGQWPSNPNEVLVGAGVAEAARLEPGHRMTLGGRNRSQARYEQEVTVTGLIRTGGVEDGFIFMALEDMEKMTGEPGWVDLAEISLTASGAELAALAAEVRSGAPKVEARLVKRVARSEETVLAKLKTLVFLVTLVIMVLTMICVATTMMTVVMERRREIGLKKALGAGNMSLTLEFLAEGLALGLAGGLLGSGSGLIFAQIISHNVFHRFISTPAHLVPLTVMVSAAVTTLACLIPVRRAVNLDPALVLRGE